MNRFIITFAVGVLAYMIALDLGVPAWRAVPPGDATDFGVVTAIVVWYAMKEFAVRMTISGGPLPPLVTWGDTFVHPCPEDDEL